VRPKGYDMNHSKQATVTACKIKLAMVNQTEHDRLETIADQLFTQGATSRVLPEQPLIVTPRSGTTPKIAVVSLCTGDMRDIGELTFKNKAEYCRRHGYGFHGERREQFREQKRATLKGDVPPRQRV
jgi:hypothetical protein